MTTNTTTKNTLSAPSAYRGRDNRPAVFASWLGYSACCWIEEEAGADFLRDFAEAHFLFTLSHEAPDMWVGDDGLLRTQRDLVNEYNEAREDEETEAYFEENEIECFQDFMDDLTAMGGFLHPLYDYFGITIDGTDTAERFEYIEDAFDEAERWLIHHPGEGKRVTIVRYIPA